MTESKVTYWFDPAGWRTLRPAVEANQLEAVYRWSVGSQDPMLRPWRVFVDRVTAGDEVEVVVSGLQRPMAFRKEAVGFARSGSEERVFLVSRLDMGRFSSVKGWFIVGSEFDAATGWQVRSFAIEKATAHLSVFEHPPRLKLGGDAPLNRGDVERWASWPEFDLADALSHCLVAPGRLQLRVSPDSFEHWWQSMAKAKGDAEPDIH